MKTLRTALLTGLTLVGLATSGAAPSRAQDVSAIPALAGTWTVTGVEVSSLGVQALVHDDPVYMGKRVLLDATQFAWAKSATSGGTTNDACLGPQMHRVAIPSAASDDRLAALPSKPIVAYAVTCATGSWGPDDAEAPRLYRLANGGLALNWYDSGLLRLSKSGNAPASSSAAPVPAAAAASGAQIPVERIRASTADPRVRDYDYDDVVLNGGPETRGAPLVVFMPGTGGGENGGPRLLEETVAHLGNRVIFLPYDTLPPGNQLCPRRPPQCYWYFRASRTFGGDGAPVATPPAEAIVTRLASLLRYLDHEHPEAGWRDYIAPDGSPAWPNIVVSGLSQGAGMAAFLAKRFPVRRVVLFSSPWDAVGPEQIPAPWLYRSSATPPDRWWAERHARENTTRLLANAYGALGIPPEHLFVFDGGLPPDASGPNPYHGSTVTQAGYVRQWRTMFGRRGPGE